MTFRYRFQLILGGEPTVGFDLTGRRATALAKFSVRRPDIANSSVAAEPESRQDRLFQEAKRRDNLSTRYHPIPRKDMIVLTFFFEYLRQRAFESVVTGAQEALELLETQGYFDKPAARINDRLQGMEKDTAASTRLLLRMARSQKASQPPSQPTSDVAEAKPPRKRSTRKGSRE